MSDFEKMSKELLTGGKKGAVNSVVNSKEGKNISKMVDGKALKKAAMEGDQETLNRILGQVLSTEDGKAFVRKISESFGKK